MKISHNSNKNSAQSRSSDMQNLHKNFVQLGRDRNKITYKLLALLPQIYKLKIYEQEGYANIYDYAAKIAGLSSGVVSKAIKVDEKLKEMPQLREAIKTQGINKVAIIAGLATRENEKELAEKVINMSKPALQEYSKEMRGKVTVSWQIEMDEQMMFMLLKLKKQFGKNLSNKECLRMVLEEVSGEADEKKQKNLEKKLRLQKLAKKQHKIPEEKLYEKSRSQSQGKKQYKISTATTTATAGRAGQAKRKQSPKITRHVSAQKTRETLAPTKGKCSHKNCHRPAEVIHHPDRFSENPNHNNLKPLCKYHHEFAHNGITEPMQKADYQYRKYRQAALIVEN